jgi:DNA-binding transcriptional LysR family regulator
MRVNMRQLQAFRAVVKLGSVTGAGQALGLSQPTVSNLVIALEDELGVALFYRVRRRLVPTSEGLSFFKEVDRTFDSIERLSNAADRITARSSAWLNVVLPQCFVVSIIPEALKRLHETHPGVGVTLEYLPSKEAVELVASGEWDFGVTRIPFSHRGVDAQVVMKSEYVCVLPATHKLARREKISPKDLADETLVLQSRRHEARFTIEEAFRKAGSQLRSVVETGALTGSCALTSSGVGISILDAILMEGYPDENLTIRPFEPPILNEFALIREKSAELGSEARAFVEAILGAARDLSQSPNVRFSIHG